MNTSKLFNPLLKKVEQLFAAARGSTLERLLKIADLLEIDGAAAELVARICGVAKTCPPAE